MNIKTLQTKKIGITILGGGMRCTAYAGMLKAFEEYQVNIQAIIGSSGGAVVGASYAFENSIEKILNHFKIFNPLSLLNPIKLFTNRRIDYSPWETHASKLVPMNKKIEDSKIKLCIKAVDIKTQESVYISTGPAVKAVIASSAILNSYRIGNKEYIDGDYDPETGAEQLCKMGADISLLAYIQPEKNSKFENLIITQSNALRSDIMLHKPDITLELPISNGFILSKNNVKKNYTEGYRFTKKFLASLSNSLD